METHQTSMRDVVEALAYIVKGLDPVGIHMFLTNDRAERRSAQSTKALLNCLDNAPFTGTANMRSLLYTRLNRYWRPFLGDLPRRNVYVLTDGVWQRRCDVAPVISSLCEVLSHRRCEPAHLGIQFIVFGHNQAAIQRLESLVFGQDFPQ